MLVDGHGPEGPGRCGAASEVVVEVGVVQLIVRVLTKDQVLLDGTGVVQVAEMFRGLGQVLLLQV